MRGPVQKICGHCSQAFQCGGYQCWCGSLGITVQQMDWIAGQYEDCLCKICLEKVATGNLGPQMLPPIQPTS
jgi:hypothetical protein